MMTPSSSTGRDTSYAASALFPDAAERQRLDALLDTQLAELPLRIATRSVVPHANREQFARELASYDFCQAMPLQTVLQWAIERLQDGLVQVTHPRYFGLFNPAPSFPAQCADRIVGAFNPQLASATTSPAAVAIEAHVIRAVAQRAGFAGEIAGHFTSGGSEANCTALICALTAAHPDFAQAGVRGFAGPPVFYVSREAHLAWIKIAHQAGIGRDAVRLVETDDRGRMSIAALAAACSQDRAHGRIPVMLVATAGTTGGGAIDPLDALATFARDEGIWLHVDAAWGGAAIASPRHRGLLAGIERAQSITIDAHKWFATTMGCGMFIARDPKLLSATFHVSTSFMPSEAAGVDPYMNSLQWSRRFLGLRLFVALATAGWSGYAAHVEKAVAQAAELANALAASGWRVVNDPALAVLCVVPPVGAPDPVTIVRRVLASGAAWISTAVFAGHEVIRICISNGETTSEDIAALVQTLQEARHNGRVTTAPRRNAQQRTHRSQLPP